MNFCSPTVALFLNYDYAYNVVMRRDAMLMGGFEQMVLLSVLHVGDDAYAVSVRRAIEARTGRRVTRGALYTSLERLEGKGYLRSRMGEPTPERGGRSRRYYRVTPAGVRALKVSKQTLVRLWQGLESVIGD